MLVFSSYKSCRLIELFIFYFGVSLPFKRLFVTRFLLRASSVLLNFTSTHLFISLASLPRHRHWCFLYRRDYFSLLNGGLVPWYTPTTVNLNHSTHNRHLNPYLLLHLSLQLSFVTTPYPLTICFCYSVKTGCPPNLVFLRTPSKPLDVFVRMVKDVLELFLKMPIRTIHANPFFCYSPTTNWLLIKGLSWTSMRRLIIKLCMQRLQFQNLHQSV